MVGGVASVLDRNPVASAGVAELRDLWRVEGAEDQHLVTRLHDEVMAPAFAPEELPDLDLLLAALGEGGTGVLTVALADDGAPVGGAVSSFEPAVRIGLLEYLATRPDQRGSGLGATMLQHQAQHWARWPVDVVLAEVRDPRAGPQDPEDRPDARVRFYERHGARLVMVPWVQPSLRDGLARMQHELLLSLHPPGLQQVDSGALALWAAGYFEMSEGGVPTDEQYRAVMQAIEESAEVAVRPVAALAGLSTVPTT